MQGQAGGIALEVAKGATRAFQWIRTRVAPEPEMGRDNISQDKRPAENGCNKGNGKVCKHQVNARRTMANTWRRSGLQSLCWTFLRTWIRSTSGDSINGPNNTSTWQRNTRMTLANAFIGEAPWFLLWRPGTT